MTIIATAAPAIAVATRPASSPDAIGTCAGAGAGAGEALAPAPRLPLRSRLRDETGASTAEYAITVLAACGFAAVLVVLLKSGEVRSLLMNVITSALALGS